MKTIKLMMITLITCLMLNCTTTDNSVSETSNKVPSSGEVMVDNGEGKTVSIPYNIMFGVDTLLTFKNLNDIADKANSDAINSCVNERTFKPEKMSMFRHSNSDTLSVTYKFVAANSYGVEENLTNIMFVSIDSLINENYNFVIK